jgi:hypothetical protein
VITLKANGKKNKLLIVIFLIVVVIIILSTQISKVKMVVVEDLDDYKKTEFILPDRNFSIGYIHSVELTPAEEFLEIQDNNDMLLYKTIYQSFGVGLPFSQEENVFDIIDGEIVLERDRVMSSIRMVISPIPKHWITVNGEKHQLIDLISNPEDSIDIYGTECLAIKIGNKYYKIF